MRSKCEVLLEGEGPWKLPDDSDDFELVFTPGHTAGHVCMYYKPEKVCLAPACALLMCQRCVKNCAGVK